MMFPGSGRGQRRACAANLRGIAISLAERYPRVPGVRELASAIGHRPV
jgi:hypothetical protein